MVQNLHFGDKSQFIQGSEIRNSDTSSEEFFPGTSVLNLIQARSSQ